MHSSIDRSSQVQHMFNFGSKRHRHPLSAKNDNPPAIGAKLAANAKFAWAKSNNKLQEIEFHKCRQFAIDHLTYLCNTIDGSMPFFTTPKQLELFRAGNRKRS